MGKIAAASVDMCMQTTHWMVLQQRLLLLYQIYAFFSEILLQSFYIFFALSWDCVHKFIHLKRLWEYNEK